MGSPRLSIGTMDDTLPLVGPTGEVSDTILDNPRSNVFFRRSGVKTTLIGLKHPCALYFQGILELNVISGSAIINGYRASAGDPRMPLRLFSMREGSAQCISTADDSIISVDLHQFHPQLQPMIKDLIDRIGPAGCVICVSPRVSHYSHWKSAFKKHQLDVFPDVSKAVGLSLFSGAEKLLDSVLDVKDGSRIARKLVISEELEDLSAELISSVHSSCGTSLQSSNDSLERNNTCILLCGGKGVGKSSYLKYLINRYLSSGEAILYIDLDIGQPEFTLGGCLSAVIVNRPLIGPNFTHTTTPVRSYSVGDVNPVQCINSYIISVEKLAEFCQSDNRCKSLPWFINTMGMTKGLGLDFLVLAMKSFRPSHVVQFNSNKTQENFCATLTGSFMRQFIPNLKIPRLEDIRYVHHLVSSVAKAQTRSLPLPTAQKLRELVAVEFLSTLFKQRDEVQLRELSAELKSEGRAAGLIHGDIVALCQKDETAYVIVAYGIITLQPTMSVFSSVDDVNFSNVNCIQKVPVKFKGTTVLGYVTHRPGPVPNVCSFDLTYLKGENKDTLKVLFGLE